jgi:hypothetical protein
VTPLDENYGYARSPADIYALYLERRKARSPIISQMEMIRNHVNGDVVVPLPEMDRDEKSFVANLIQTGLDSIGQRISDRMPDLTCPATDPRKPTSQAKADIRRRANLSWWESNGVRRQMRRRARFLIGYGASPVAIRPDFERGIPRWEPRNPLTAFPAPTLDPDDLCPSDTIYAVRRTLASLRREYPSQVAAIAGRNELPDTMYTVLEYDDNEQLCTLVIGNTYGQAQLAVLECVPNRAGISLSVVPGRITLDRMAGQFDGLLGMYNMRAKLMALEVLAVQRGVFPDTYLISRPGETARFVSGPHPGSSGLVNEIEGGDIKEVTVNPGFANLQVIDRLERAERQAGGIPAELSGESATNIRTGRRGNAVLSSAIDPGIQEAQETFASSMQEENYRATKTALAYFGSQPKSFHVNWKGAKGHVTYTPKEHFDSSYTEVNYSMAGADANEYVVGAGQRVGLGTLSKKSFMAMDPYVEDADRESDLVTTEGLEAALLQSVQQQAASGEFPLPDLARLVYLVKVKNVDFTEAANQVHEEAQKRQAAVTAEGAPDAVDPLSPAAQPGIAAPGAGAEAGVAIGEPPTALGNLDQLLMQMRGTSAGAA